MMNHSTIKQLNKLNQDFYQKIAISFDQTRQYSWQGWLKLLPYLSKVKQPIRVLDIGCGNGRFASFLNEKKLQFSYHGIDSSPELIKTATAALKKLNIHFKLTKLDVIQALLDDSLTSQLGQKYDLIVAFGLLHHLPSSKVRQKLFINISQLLSDTNSLAVITAWQFATDDRYQDKFIESSKAGFSIEKLEKNDYILGWKDHPTAFRYCHFVDDEEVKQLSQNLINLKIIDDFLADGKSNQLNRYLIFSKK